ncbi:f4142bcf-309c-4034-8b02-b5d7888fe437 [Thermothielavioides terrestris]|uniref:F4142bcf-309c-4034-8b02-b5d7888fe437 n=1 Tax=Thermothielavioides terrestris TaxID=2587410 RepID=A0A446BRI5_9PEZI|nr:f4142bcf-309c-4034-8b02-b5d7888fe437 [Thermothielavioides terrestris]
MVKLDYDRDYYADLELPPTADAAEVKKQFKKLALKWHPDRNPGREEAAKEKFLIIQAAHEILSDPISKNKFDAHRQRTSRYPAASGVRGNPWQYTTQEVNQRYGAPPRRPPMPTRQPPPKAAPTSQWNWAQSAKMRTESARANMDAWDRARPQTKPSQPTTAPGGTDAGAAGAARASKPREPPIPRTAAQARRQEAAFGTRKSGYAPASPAGDEPPVKNQHYNTGAYTAQGAGATQTSKPKPASAFVDPLSAQFMETFLDSRQRTPYAANVGEKTNPFEPLNIHRAKSMRDGTRRPQDGADEAPPTPPPRQRSASVGSDNLKRSTSEKPSFNEPSTKPAFPFQSRARERYSPHGPDANSAPPTATFPASNSTAPPVNSRANGATVEGVAAGQAQNGTKVFSVPDDDLDSPAPHARFTRNSADNINTRFVAEEKSGASFEFSAGATTSTDHDGFLRAKQRARTQQSPLRNQFTPSAEPSSGAPQPETGKKHGEFVAEEWKEAFGPHIFEPPQANKASTSPTRPIRPIKKPRPVRMTAGTAGMVEEEETSGEEKGKPGSRTSGIDGSRSPNAMDIDSTPPPEPSAAQQANGPRNINIEPTKPEWRAGNANGINAEPEPRPGPGTGTGTGTAPAPAPAPTPAPKVPTPNPNAAGSEDSEEFFRPLFSEFRNVEPFAQKPTGLGSFADLSANLPFPSRASAKVPLAPEKPRQLDIPAPPTAPRAPASLCIPGTKASAPAWTTYVREFEAYVALWLDFNRRVTDHFAARQRAHERKGLAWLDAQGDAGVLEYLRALEEDKIVRQRWMAACEAHELHFREFMGWRERMLGGLNGAGLN